MRSLAGELLKARSNNSILGSPAAPSVERAARSTKSRRSEPFLESLFPERPGEMREIKSLLSP